jgi:hypothetical protein
MSIKVHKFVDKQFSVFYANYYKFKSDLQPLSLFLETCVLVECLVYSFVLCFWKLYHRQTDKTDILFYSLLCVCIGVVAVQY